MNEIPSRDEIASRYLDSLPYPPYPVQEEAILTYFTSDQGVLVSAPTGTGKTLIAEAALFEALHTGKQAYYTTPLIALTEQKFADVQASAVRWGFSADDVGLVTGNRRVNPQAKILVVVAEILLNRLLHKEAFDFADVSAVVMDEFHSFADTERGMVWELSLGLLPTHVRLLLLSATVGNAFEFRMWLKNSHDRAIELVQSFDRKVPLTFHWVGDQLLTEQLELMVEGPEDLRFTPALVFCFNRDECWDVADTLKGKPLVGDAQKKLLEIELAQHDWSKGAGPKLKAILQRGIGLHHAGILPKYRRVVEELFQKKLLTVCVCTETLAAGINLPARSVLLPTLLKGKPGDKKLIDASSAHQIFGRAGRPQYDTQGHVFSLAHEDDVKILRWKEKADKIPEDTKDPNLIRARKELNRKKPIRRSTEQYWGQAQFEQLRTAAPLKLSSRGQLPWRLLAYLLEASSDVEPIRHLVSKRLLDSGKQIGAQKILDRMLRTLEAAGYVTLDPPSPKIDKSGKPIAAETPVTSAKPAENAVAAAPAATMLTFGSRAPAPAPAKKVATNQPASTKKKNEDEVDPNLPPPYQAKHAHPTPQLERLTKLRSINPLYGVYIVDQLGIASREERIQAFESVLELPGSVARHCRVPPLGDMPAGPLATQKLNIALLQRGLATPYQLGAEVSDEEYDAIMALPFELRPRVLTLADKLRLQFDADYHDVHSLFTQPCWVAGEVLQFAGNFEKYVTSRGLQKQEGVLFRHLLRMILLLKELSTIHPPEVTAEQWKLDLDEIAEQLTEACRRVDPSSTDKVIEEAQRAADGEL